MAIRYPKREILKFLRGEDYRKLPLGKAELLMQGQSIVLLAVGSMVEVAVKAATRLQKSGLNCTVVNARFVKPLDEELILNLARNNKNIITLEENVVAGGFGSAVTEFLIRTGIKGITCKSLGIPDQFITHGPTEVLLRKCGLDVDGVCRSVKEFNLPSVGIRAGF